MSQDEPMHAQPDDGTPPLRILRERQVFREQNGADYTVTAIDAVVRATNEPVTLHVTSVKDGQPGAVCIAMRTFPEGTGAQNDQSGDRKNSLTDALRSGHGDDRDTDDGMGSRTDGSCQAPADLARGAAERTALYTDGCAAAEPHFLLARHWRAAIDDWQWEFPRGMGEHGETAKQTAARELREETGIRVDESNVRILQTIHADSGVLRDNIAIAAIIVPSDAAHEPDTDWELTDPQWIPASRFRAMIASGEITDGITLAAWAVWQATSARDPAADSLD